jgi:hypothetical protein
MSPFRDLADWIFSSFALVVACVAVFDTHRIIRLLSYGRKTDHTILQVLALRIPGAVIITGIIGKMWITLQGKP